MRYPLYTTFGSDDELTAAINKLDLLRSTAATAALRQESNGGALLKSYDYEARFPDGATGGRHYVRGGPAWHVFRFDHPGRPRPFGP